jgi:hypothetical protein
MDETREEKFLIRLNQDIDPERAQQYLGKEMVENEEERDEVLWRTGQALFTICRGFLIAPLCHLEA